MQWKYQLNVGKKKNNTAMIEHTRQNNILD